MTIGTIRLPDPPQNIGERELRQWMSDMRRELERFMLDADRIKQDKRAVFELDERTVANLPSVTKANFIYVSDETGGATVAFSDGTNWRRCQDRAIVS